VYKWQSAVLGDQAEQTGKLDRGVNEFHESELSFGLIK
jgi:hypothetical protein